MKPAFGYRVDYNGHSLARQRIIAAHHTDAAEAARLFQRVNPRLTIFSHANLPPAETLAAVRPVCEGRVEFGADLMTIDIGDEIAVHRPDSARQ